MEEILALSQQFLTIHNQAYRRYFLKTTPLEHRCIILLGQRGVGKTTTLVQHLLDHVNGDLLDSRILYIQTDHFLMGNVALYKVAEYFYNHGGEVIAFDEIHKYPNWSKELKSIYDTFPKLKILASGSSALEIHKGSHDLSRRALIYVMHGLSFREYIELRCEIKLESYPLATLLSDHKSIALEINQTLDEYDLKILALFKEYICGGFYPYFLSVKPLESYWLTLEQNMHVTIESDLVAIYPHLTGNSIKKLKELVRFIAKAVPFTPNWNRIKSIINVADDRTVKTYFKYLEDANLIRIVSKYSTTMKKLSHTEKIFIHNTNQMQAFSLGHANKGSIRETFFLSMLCTQHNVELPADGDFMIDDTYTFEVGGKKKNFNQIKTAENAYLACDDITAGIGNKLPLWVLGFMY